MLTDKRHFELPEEAKTCSMCGALRTFECQLMPPLVYVIQSRLLTRVRSTDTPPPAAVEFGTVLIYSCSASCWWSEEERCRNESTELFRFRKELGIVQTE